MISSKRLIEMARKWKKMAALGRKRISPARRTAVASRGHVFVYSADGRQFMVPLAYLSSNIFLELLRISEEEFGLPTDGPITFPCDAAFMESALSLLSISNCRVDGRRFMVPLAYLSSIIFLELLRISEEEFGLPADGPITFPCDAAFMECALSHPIAGLRHLLFR